VFDIFFYIFVLLGEMKRYKVRQVIRLLEKDGWVMDRIRGDHRQFTHKNKSGTVTVTGKLSDDLSQFLLNSIWKQAGWKF
jgi:predicted RNA binding protein YcfA (HicA-like mRNA interferase family)